MSSLSSFKSPHLVVIGLVGLSNVWAASWCEYGSETLIANDFEGLDLWTTSDSSMVNYYESIGELNVQGAGTSETWAKTSRDYEASRYYPLQLRFDMIARPSDGCCRLDLGLPDDYFSEGNWWEDSTWCSTIDSSEEITIEQSSSDDWLGIMFIADDDYSECFIANLELYGCLATPEPTTAFPTPMPTSPSPTTAATSQPTANGSTSGTTSKTSDSMVTIALIVGAVALLIGAFEDNDGVPDGEMAKTKKN